MSSFIKPNGKCCYNTPLQSPIIYPEKNHVIFGNNLIGADGWPASRPNQSNMGYSDGVSGFRSPNGEGPYIYSKTCIIVNGAKIIIPHLTTYRLTDNNNPYVRKYITYVEDEPYKYMILAKDLMVGDDIIGMGKVQEKYKVVTNRLNPCCLCNIKC